MAAPLQSIAVDFRIHYATVYGESLHVLGSGPLGSWSPELGLPLHYHDGWWRGRLVLPLKPAGAGAGVPGGGEPGPRPPNVEYKYVLRRQDGSVVWECGPNRVLVHGGASDGLPDHMEVRDTWRQPTASGKPFFSAAFTDVVFHRDHLDTKPPSLPPAAKPGTMVRLQVFAPRVPPSSTLCVAGNCDALGDWDPGLAVPLSDSGYPLWVANVTIPPEVALPLQYKYVLRPADGDDVVWEGGPNRILDQLEVPGSDTPPEHAALRARSRSWSHTRSSSRELTSTSPYTSCGIFVTDNSFLHTGPAWKGAGVSVPVFSLRSHDGMGVGEFLDLKALADVCVAAGLQMIELLPVLDTIRDGTVKDMDPYHPMSAFALHPLYLRITAIPGLPLDLKRRAAACIQRLNATADLDYAAVMTAKLELLHKAYSALGGATLRSPDFVRFLSEHEHWLRPYALHSAMRDAHGTVDRAKWRRYSTVSEKRVKAITSAVDGDVYDDVGFWFFVQFHLHAQLREAVQHAARRGVVVKGDLPIGLSAASVDVWMSPHLFSVDSVAGLPPGPGSPRGQNWHFPSYNWDAMALDGHAWWKQRLAHMESLFTAVRLNHIVGYLRMWTVPRGNPTGTLGRYSPAVPVHRDQLERRGLWDIERLTKPYIRTPTLVGLWGDTWRRVADEYLVPVGEDAWVLRGDLMTEAAIVTAGITDVSVVDGLVELVGNVILLHDSPENDQLFHPRAAMSTTSSFAELDEHAREQMFLANLEYWQSAQSELWTQHGLSNLSVVSAACNLLLCGEDLGVTSEVTHQVMSQLEVLSLKSPRQRSSPDKCFTHPADLPYLCVATTSHHSEAPLRQWWAENPDARAVYCRELFGMGADSVPPACTSDMAYRVVEQVAFSDTMWAVFPIQDLLATYADVRLGDGIPERVSGGTRPWTWRLHIALEDLACSDTGIAFCAHLKSLFQRSGRR